MIVDVEFLIEAFTAICKSIPVTLELAVFSFVIGFVAAVCIALVIYYQVRILEKVFRFYISVIRGTPLMLQLYIIYYAIPMLVDTLCEGRGWAFRSSMIPTMTLVILALSLHISAYLAETIRSGIMSVSVGEIEAAYTIGMKNLMIIRRVILPQAFRVCIPNFSTQFINILHGSSLAFYVTVLEITGTAQILAQDNWKYFETYLAAGLIYWILTIIVEIITHFIEKTLHKHMVSVA